MKQIVLTGGHGVGKTSLLSALEERGEHVVPEAARDVRLLDIASGVAFPEDQLDFESRVLARHLARERAVPTRLKRVFFDRGAPDHLAYATVGRWSLTDADIAACRSRHYQHVFLLDGPPGEPPTIDRVERAFCQRLVCELERVYAELGMPVHRLVWAPVAERVKAILAVTGGKLL